MNCTDEGWGLPMLQVSTLCRAAGRIIPGHHPVGNDTDKGRKQQCQNPVQPYVLSRERLRTAGRGRLYPLVLIISKSSHHYLLCGKIINIFAKK